jgi:hypothetical protein
LGRQLADDQPLAKRRPFDKKAAQTFEQLQAIVGEARYVNKPS